MTAGATGGETATRSYLSVLLRILAAVPSSTIAERRRIYAHMQDKLLVLFDAQTPPLDEESRDIEFRILRHTNGPHF